MINKNRLSVARRRRGLTKKELAEKVGIDSRSMTGFESGEYQPSDETLHVIARVLQFPHAFFFGDDLEEPPRDSVSFRAMSKMAAGQRDAALTASSIAFLLDEWTEKRFDLPSPDLLDLRHATPEAAAVSLRQYWGIGERPVRNMVHLLEAKGVRVFSLAENCVEVDAYSFWKGKQPFIFLNTYKSAEHSRYDAAHELGHLVLHRHGAPNGQEAEKEANDFASAFLMPAGSVLAIAPVAPSLSHLLRLKKRWAVSLAALVVRLHRLNLLTDWHYRTLCIEMQQRGDTKQEREGIQRENSQVWDKVFSSLRGEGVTKDTIAKELTVPPHEIEMLVFGLVMISISSSPSKTPTKARGQLSLVERA